MTDLRLQISPFSSTDSATDWTAHPRDGTVASACDRTHHTAKDTAYSSEKPAATEAETPPTPSWKVKKKKIIRLLRLLPPPPLKGLHVIIDHCIKSKHSAMLKRQILFEFNNYKL